MLLESRTIGVVPKAPKEPSNGAHKGTKGSMGKGGKGIPGCIVLGSTVGNKGIPPIDILKRYPEPHGQVTAYNRSPVH